MPVENFEEEGLEKIPDLRLPQWAFQIKSNVSNKEEIKEKLMNVIIANDMAPYYEALCRRDELGWAVDAGLVARMRAANEARVAQLDEAIRTAEEKYGDTEVREAMIARAHYLSKIGARERAEAQFEAVLEKTLMLGYRLDVTFHLARLGFFWMDYAAMARHIERAGALIEEGGDWDRRNRLKVYRGLYNLAVRDFEGAASQFLEAVATFTSYELMEYKTFIVYTVLAAMVALRRAELREKVVLGSEILEVLHALPGVREYLMALYECRYADFFRSLAGVECLIKADVYWSPHYRFYVREMRVLAYRQHLESYSYVGLENMSRLFAVTPAFIERELCRFNSSGKLACKIDQRNGVIETTRADTVNARYQSVIKHGDILLNRIQKLSRVINI